MLAVDLRLQPRDAGVWRHIVDPEEWQSAGVELAVGRHDANLINQPGCDPYQNDERCLPFEPHRRATGIPAAAIIRAAHITVPARNHWFRIRNPEWTGSQLRELRSQRAGKRARLYF